MTKKSRIRPNTTFEFEIWNSKSRNSSELNFFTAFCYIFKVITLVGSYQRNYLKNACWKLMLQLSINSNPIRTTKHKLWPLYLIMDWYEYNLTLNKAYIWFYSTLLTSMCKKVTLKCYDWQICIKYIFFKLHNIVINIVKAALYVQFGTKFFWPH